MDHFDTDVLIVGAGPTGLMLAGELRLSGVGAIVVDRLTEPVRQSRALGFSARTVEEFDQRGLLPRFGELNTIPVGHFGGLALDYRVLEGGSYGARGKPQSLTEAVLAGWSAELGAELRRGHEVTGLVEDPDGVTADIATPEGPRRVRARYLAGCDGGRSTIRKLAGVDFPGTDPAIEMWFADVAGCALRPRFSGERVPGGMVMVLPLGPDVNRVVVYERGAMRRQSEDALSFAEVADAWERLTGEDIHGGTPLWISWITDSSRQAAAYRRGRVFLLGDAAHIHLPTGAQGMSAGIGDAMNLGWKLGAAIGGYAPPGLLDTYHSERHPVGARIVANTLAQRILYLTGEEIEPMREVMAELMAIEEVQRHLVGMVTGLDIRYDVGPGDHPLLGRRLPGAGLTGESMPLEFLHAGRGVVLDLAGNEDVHDVAVGWADRVRVVTATARTDGALKDVEVALVRPDGYIAWIGSGGSGVSGLTDTLTRWFGAPLATAVPASAQVQQSL